MAPSINRRRRFFFFHRHHSPFTTRRSKHLSFAVSHLPCRPARRLAPPFCCSGRKGKRERRRPAKKKRNGKRRERERERERNKRDGERERARRRKKVGKEKLKTFSSAAHHSSPLFFLTRPWRRCARLCCASSCLRAGRQRESFFSSYESGFSKDRRSRRREQEQ